MADPRYSAIEVLIQTTKGEIAALLAKLESSRFKPMLAETYQGIQALQNSLSEIETWRNQHLALLSQAEPTAAASTSSEQILQHITESLVVLVDNIKQLHAFIAESLDQISRKLSHSRLPSNSIHEQYTQIVKCYQRIAQQPTSKNFGREFFTDADVDGCRAGLVMDTTPTSFTFRTLAGTHTIDVRPSESREAALARHFGVDARRIVLQMLDDESCVSVLDPFEIYHDSRSPEYRCPPGFMELYRQNLGDVDWSTLSQNPGAFELLAEHLDEVDWGSLSLNSHPGAVALLAANLDNDDLDRVDWGGLSENPGAVDILAAYPHKIWWQRLSSNSHSRAFEMMANLGKIDWWALSTNTNPAAIEVLAAHSDKIDWSVSKLSSNPNAIEFLSANQDKINWHDLSKNRNGIDLLTANQDKIDWCVLSQNPNAIELLSANLDKIDWSWLSGNRNAIELLAANQDKINWLQLSKNPNAIELLSVNLDKIDWIQMSINPSAASLLAQNKSNIEWTWFCRPRDWIEKVD